jgi:hypothetical protein
MKKQPKNKTKTIKKTINKTTNKQKTINSARFETQRDFVLLPNRRSLLIPLALKVHSLLCCQAATQTHKIQQGLRSQSIKQCAHYP